MNFDTLALIALLLAAIPCGLFLLNLTVYRPLANPKTGNTEPISVLIPARNEQKNIRTTLERKSPAHSMTFIASPRSLS